jgi:hypothetical protein
MQEGSIVSQNQAVEDSFVTRVWWYWKCPPNAEFIPRKFWRFEDKILLFTTEIDRGFPQPP